MNQRVMKGIILAIIILGVIGVLLNPMWLVRQVAFIAVVGGIIYLAYRFYAKRKLGKEYSSYMRAAKQSKRRYNEQKTPVQNVRSFSQARKTISTSAKKKKQPSHLTVIEGKKGKKKNRAHF
ncbi:SA1362 family protein [Metabacillus malikii]|uniref:ABC-type multidrug transport system fused ATPase/permease subunit n=1 Tax=Metabacillus malikii TaxID=1504265 RepID=A0ABT9ZI30_9BACI|nr:SA1362 family protein [Metabacillus malikii]MDQ0231941.1 ABC-type multidrug transport system fused ATPase/permease subunit [Metabacillus malikii]